MDCYAFSVRVSSMQLTPNKPSDGGFTSSYNTKKEITAFRVKVLGNK